MRSQLRAFSELPFHRSDDNVTMLSSLGAVHWQITVADPASDRIARGFDEYVELR